MPHIPRNSAPTTGIPPELIPRPKASHTPIPVSQPQQQAQEPEGRRLKIGLSKLSPHTYQPDQQHIINCVLGKNVHVDPNTGQLVLTNHATTDKAPQ